MKRKGAKKDGNKSKVTVRGFFRAQLVDNGSGKISGDTGWVENSLTNYGLLDLACLLGGVSGSQKVAHAVVATQSTALNMTQSSMLGTVNSFTAVAASTIDSGTIQFTCQFASSNLGTNSTNSCNAAAVALHSSNAVGGMIAAQTFTPMTWNTNQDFNLTYQIRFATTT